MKNFVVTVLAVIVALMLVAMAGFLGLALLTALSGSGESVPSKVLLELDLEQGMIEYRSPDPFAAFMNVEIPTLRELIDGLDRAADDRRVVGVIANIGAAPIGMAQAQELRDAILRFRQSGKPAVVFSETFGEVGPGNTAYYLATAFDEIYLQPSGDIGLTGLMYETPFLGGVMEKLSVEPEMGQRHEYKNAMNMYTETSFTEPHEEALAKVMYSQFGQMVRGIAEQRDLEEEQVRALVDEAPLLGSAALDAGLVDGMAYRDEVYAKMREQVGDRADLLFMHHYVDRAGSPYRKGDTIGLVYGVGQVVRGPSGYDPLTGSQFMGSDSVAANLRAAVDNKRVKAIVFRVDSPGGSYVASDAIWRETVRAREAGKPVIVSMGNVAGSGGYFVAMEAEKIVAQPGTITGSIGVLGGKMYTKEMWDKIGMAFDSVQAGRNADMWSGTYRYSETGRARLDAWLDRVYEDFTGKVAEGRDMPIEEVQQVAKGRIWSGEDALEIGLVDELGGIDTALRLAREAIGLEPDADIRVRVFPAEKTPLELLFDRPESSDARASVVRSIRRMQSLAREAERVGLVNEQPGVRMRDVPTAQ
ncbi:hypothetical protein ABI59_05120 [Acidobacteria bacterium Mor1]|nr:hypothetical protein ABI59_05120 [Acidobacteria bacterium Mor1]